MNMIAIEVKIASKTFEKKLKEYVTEIINYGKKKCYL